MSEPRPLWSLIHQLLYLKPGTGVEIEIADFARISQLATIPLHEVKLVEYGRLGSVHKVVDRFRMPAANSYWPREARP